MTDNTAHLCEGQARIEAMKEAERRYPVDFRTVGGSAAQRRAFIAGAEWQRANAPSPVTPESETD